MEWQHELGGYLHCGDTSRIAQAIREQLEAEGMVCVERARGLVPDVASKESNIWRVAVIPGRAGWHLLLAAPEALLCEALPGGAIRFAALSDALGAPGFLREAHAFEDGVGLQGEVKLLTDGNGLHRIVGKLLDFDAGHESTQYYDVGEPQWRGHVIDHDQAEDANPWPAIAASIPEEGEEDPDRYESNLSEARHGLWLVERLGGRKLSAYWREEAEAWGLLNDCLLHGEPLPVDGAITLSFEWPARDRAWPKAAPEADRPPFEYGDGAMIRIGDRVRLVQGAEGEVVNLLATIHREQGRARYAVVRIDGTVRMVSMSPVKRDVYRFVDFIRVSDAVEPIGKPSVDELERAAEKGDVGAMVQLGFIYYVGDGQRSNPPGSCRWLAAAAALNHPDACHLLAEHYRAEFGVAYDRKKILALAEAGYRHGSVEAADIVIDYTPSDSLEVTRRMAGDGNPIAQFELAKRLRDGKGVEPDAKEAARLFELAAAQGHTQAQHEIGQCYESGRGVGKSDARAAYWYGLAIERGSTWTYPLLARLYAEGCGVSRDVDRATAMLQYASREGIPGAAEALAELEGV